MIYLERFRYFADCYGTNISRWPDTVQNAALAFFQANPEHAKTIFDDVRALDVLLEQAHLEPVEAALSAQIIASAELASSPIPNWARLAAVVTLVCGLGIGWFGSLPQAGSGIDEDDALYMYAFGSVAQFDWTETSEGH